MSIWNNTDVKPLETFWENDQRPQFYTYSVPKIWAFEAHIIYISESSSNEHIKQDWCESMPG